ncbi:alpha/beta fold hydrolase [Lysobacter sp. GCM10012299]|uniref:alpha/beta fold hydrolase n=1 Tax=Lysobacter sp. GCM10012299 TaxID=3317333 RepID=UPI003607D242
MTVDLPLPEYPFTPQRLQVRPGIGMSYLDEGPRDGEVVVMLHGNPSWSYYWRRLVLGLRDRYRCIVPDHVGMGLSDKPDDSAGASPGYRYTLQSRIDDVETLLQTLGVTGPVTLAVHDWGGGIGFGWGLKHSAQIRRLVILNTGAFPLPAAKPLPKSLRLGRDSSLGTGMIRGLNAFAAITARVGVENAMPAEVRHAYLAPYDSWANRIATSRFVQDIPLGEGDAAWPLVQAMGRKLPKYADRPTFIGWGLRDFVFDKHFLEGFTDALPQAQVHAFEDAGHYVLEDKAAVLVPEIRTFLDTHPL